MSYSCSDGGIVEAAIEYIRSLFDSNSDGHGFDHTLRVYRNALLIAESEPGCDLQIVSLAALLHDADDHKLFFTENNANARRFLTGRSMPEDRIDRICEVINAVSFSKNRAWMRSAQSALPERLLSEDHTEGTWIPPSGIFMRSCFF